LVAARGRVGGSKLRIFEDSKYSPGTGWPGSGYRGRGQGRCRGGCVEWTVVRDPSTHPPARRRLRFPPPSPHCYAVAGAGTYRRGRPDCSGLRLAGRVGGTSQSMIERIGALPGPGQRSRTRKPVSGPGHRRWLWSYGGAQGWMGSQGLRCLVVGGWGSRERTEASATSKPAGQHYARGFGVPGPAAGCRGQGQGQGRCRGCFVGWIVNAGPSTQPPTRRRLPQHERSVRL
jgi:hypothetical protein